MSLAGTGTVPPPPPRAHSGRVRTDVAIVGAGVAGLYAAACLPDGVDAVVIDKGVPGGDSGSSPWAQGGLAAALGADDAPGRHADDTVRAGDGHVDPAAAAVLAREAPDHVARLLALGADFDRREDRLESTDPADLHLAREGGQSVARCVHRADATGAELVRVLRAAVADRVTRLPGLVASLARDANGRVTGCWVLDGEELIAVEARAVLLATGGCGGLYAATTNPAHATGDGLALAARAGAVLRDVEFVQFHPTGLAVSGTWRFLLTEALRGAGAVLRDAHGRGFLADAHPDAELAPRHVVAAAILERAGGQAMLDATALGEAQLMREFPSVLAGARQHGFDLASEPVPVTPAAHYHVGGVRTDLSGRTSLPGLYAAGEVAATGLHGANRMAGNSLAEALVFGARAGAAIGAELADHGPLGAEPTLAPGSGLGDLDGLRDRLREAMWHDGGPARHEDGLVALTKTLAALADELGPPAADAAQLELWHAVTAAAAIVRGAQLRRESRGGHRRSDHPRPDPALAGVRIEQQGPPPGH